MPGGIIHPESGIGCMPGRQNSGPVLKGHPYYPRPEIAGDHQFIRNRGYKQVARRHLTLFRLRAFRPYALDSTVIRAIPAFSPRLLDPLIPANPAEVRRRPDKDDTMPYGGKRWEIIDLRII